MPSLMVNGGNVVYEILGSSGDFIVPTPGGRFGKDIPGLRPLAQALADGTLDPARFESLRRLEREAAFQEARRDDAAGRARKRHERVMGRLIRDIERWHPKRR